MLFNRLDELTSDGNGGQIMIVRYQAANVQMPFEIKATRNGICITGTTPRFTDQVKINQVMVWVNEIYMELKAHGKVIPQWILDRNYV